MMTFEEALKMEERMRPFVEEILRRYPFDIKKVVFRGMKGKQDDVDMLDKLGFDALLFVGRGILTLQVKCMTPHNFKVWGMERKSFVLGDKNDIIHDGKRCKDTHIVFPDLLLTGYESVPNSNRISPFVLIHWPLLAFRIKPEMVRVEANSQKKSQLFVWMDYEKLIRRNVIVGDKTSKLICDFSAWKA